MTKIHWAAELISYLRLTQNEHDPVVFIENQKSQPCSGLAFHLRSHQVDWPRFALKKISRSLFSVV